MEFIDTWQFNLAMYYVFVVLYFQYYKIAVRNAKHDGAATIYLQLIAGLGALALAPLFAFEFPNEIHLYGLIIGACVFYAINDRLQTTLRKNLEVSVYSILGQLGTVFLIIYSFTIFGDPVVLTKITGAALILGANAWLFYDPRGKKQGIGEKKYLLLAVIAFFAFATAISIDIGISDEFNLPLYIAFTLLVPGFFIAGAERIGPKTVREEVAHSKRLPYFITGFAWTLTILFSLRAYQFGEVSTIVPLQAVAIMLNVIVAFIFQKERSHAAKKVIAAAAVIAGVYLTVA